MNYKVKQNVVDRVIVRSRNVMVIFCENTTFISQKPHFLQCKQCCEEMCLIKMEQTEGWLGTETLYVPEVTLLELEQVSNFLKSELELSQFSIHVHTSSYSYC